MGAQGPNRHSRPKCRLEHWHMIAEIVAKNPERYPTIKVGVEEEIEAMSKCPCTKCSTIFKCVRCGTGIALERFSTQQKNGWDHLCEDCTISWIDSMINIKSAQDNAENN